MILGSLVGYGSYRPEADIGQRLIYTAPRNGVGSNELLALILRLSVTDMFGTRRFRRYLTYPLPH